VRRPPECYGLARARWRLTDLRRAVPGLAAYTLGGVCQVLRRLRVRRHRGRLSLHSPDAAYDRKLAWIQRGRQRARQEPTRLRLLFGDEFSLHRQPTLAPVYAPCGEEPTAPLSWRGDTRYRYAGALDSVSGQVVWRAGTKIGVDGLGAFLRQLRAAYPQHRLLLVWDNWPIHYHPTVLATAAGLDIELLWLPTYAPWENPIEKLWRWLKQDHLHQHRRADRWAELRQQVAEFLDRFATGSDPLLRYVGLLPDSVVKVHPFSFR
jgi:transposase